MPELCFLTLQGGSTCQDPLIRLIMRLDTDFACIICWIEDLNGMSDLSMYELEDINHGDDHIVPHPTNAQNNRNSFEGESCKKPRRETTSLLSNFSNLDASNTISQGKSERDTKVLDKKKKMMEKESSSHTPPGVFNATCDVKIVKDTSDDTKIMSDKCLKTHISQPYDLYNCHDKQSSELLYYDWPDIGNLDDVDNMLRSCVSSFGLDNDEELGWFTSDQIGGGNGDPLKMDFKFPCSEASGLTLSDVKVC